MFNGSPSVSQESGIALKEDRKIISFNPYEMKTYAFQGNVFVSLGLFDTVSVIFEGLIFS
jgi:hypothetical protein